MENLKLIPQSKEAEEAVIGAIFINPESADQVFEILKHDDFYFTPTKLIFQAMEELFQSNKPIDVLSVTDLLNAKKQLDLVGGEVNIVHFADSVPVLGNVEYYSKIIKEKSLLRQLISVSGKIIDAAYDQRDPEDILNEAENMIFKIAEEENSRTYMPIREIINSTFEKIEKLKIERESPESGILVSGLPTGFRTLDAMTAGFHKSDLVIIAARPSLGKTALALTMAKNMAFLYQKKVAIFSLEMSADQLAQRMLCADGFVDLQSLRSGAISTDDWKRLTNSASRLRDLPIIIDDDPLVDVLKIRTKARKIKKEFGLDIVFVDYLQLIRSRDKRDNRQQEISDISRAMKLLARELDVCVVALSQLSRAVEQRDEKRPRLSDLRESGAIEQDADVVLFIHREDYYKAKKEEEKDQKEEANNPKEAEIIIGKQRNGPIGSIKISFLPKYALFTEKDFMH
ncbi:replicative DNA helicase [Athalassotoga saccharophila]|nr:replicative DNA helicase [Athalassotoga saccharophila]BBJ28101.1 replicative DNA helicase [Athalassotoga saccharophila]